MYWGPKKNNEIFGEAILVHVFAIRINNIFSGINKHCMHDLRYSENGFAL